ncbi:hypothetical protein BP6252_03568 [Coleophoma cylindrospora]|uniref:Capsule polysaccharide biosynthesis protein n=1 Tax=Coleophoma cylindrospora TaxID=1849047 RepID=A0A3D8S817_9HELO|nr:hypothetical protein BP6252_03568 [Coleophoma cylindrospora]
MEIDFNLHKTNSSYFSDVDIARTHLLCTLFSTGIEQMRGGTAAITGSKAPLFGIALGAVSCSFKKELKPYETYELWTRILSWDSKWIFVVTHFVRKDSVTPRRFSLYPEQNNECADDHDSKLPQDSIVASALSRCVFKQGRKTISPEFMLKASGLLPDEILADKKELVRCSATMKGEEAQAHLNMILDEKVKMTTTENVELERRRGMKVANALAVQSQQALETEFSGDEEALGKHTDGTGISGIVSTLCQLAHLRKSQTL